MHIDKHKPGSFGWMELATSDQNAAKKFYGQLFGWTFTDNPMGPGEVYTMFQLDGRDVGGGYTLRKEQQGVPSHWMLYVGVGSADDSAKKASAAGGKILLEPFDVFDIGRMAVIQDPAGAMISIWQAKKHGGTGVTGVPGTLCWADLNTKDPERATKFYSDWLGWKYETGKDGYRHIMNGSGKEDMIGGVPAQFHAPPGTPPHWLPYIQTADCKATAAKAAQLGAKTIMPAELMPEVGTIAVLADPQGAVFALYQEAARA